MTVYRVVRASDTVIADTDGQVSTYDKADDAWEPREPTGGGGASSLSDLSDVDLTGAADGDTLVREGGQWVAGSGTSVAGSVDTFADLPAPEPGKAFIVGDEVAIYVGTDSGTWHGPFPVQGAATEAAVAAAVGKPAVVEALDAPIAEQITNGAATTAAFRLAVAGATRTGAAPVGRGETGVINAKDRGAKGDGITSAATETAAIQDAIDTAATFGLGVLLDPGVYNVTRLQPKPGLAGIEGVGATLRGTSSTPEGIIATEFDAAVDDYYVTGIRFDCAGQARRAIFHRGSRARFTNNVVVGLTNPATSRQGIRIYHGSHDNLVEGNHITLGTDNPYGTFSGLEGIMVTGQHVNVFAGLDASNDPVPATNVCRGNIVRGNYVYNGTHGVSLMAAEKNVIQNNLITGQTHRAIIGSPQASHNDISSNWIGEFGSAGLHLAYASVGNHVHGNTILSTGAIDISGGMGGGEAGIQAYVHSKNNRIHGNKILTKSTRYGIYTAIHCDGTSIEANEVEGASRAQIAVESDWSSPLVSGETYGRPNYAPPHNPAWSSWDNGKGMRDITVKGNRIKKNDQGTSGAGIYIAQSKAALLENVTVDGNQIDSRDTAADDVYYYVADPAKFVGQACTRNRTFPVEVTQFRVHHPAAVFQDSSDNNWQSRARTLSANGTLDFTTTDFWALAAGVTCTGFVGLRSDPNFSKRIIRVRLSAGAVLTHDNASCRLRGGANVTGTSTNDIVTLMVLSSIAFEVGRNF